MAKNRAMAKESAVNKAKTRGAKAKVQTAKNLTLDSITIIVPRRQKQVKPTPQLNRAPSPVRWTTQPNRSPSAAGATTSGPDAIKREDILKEGWHLLKAYMDGEEHVSANEVHEFLKAVAQQELDKAFGDIMGCENDDVEGQKALEAMLEAKLAELDKPERPSECNH